MNDIGIYILGVLIGFALGGMIVFVMTSSNPTAMDVYQGKTTLEYTIVDGVKVDSCVIFKK